MVAYSKFWSWGLSAEAILLFSFFNISMEKDAVMLWTGE